MEYALAVLDLGKTNKKLVVFDEKLKVLHMEKVHISTYQEDGFDIEDVEGIEQWFLQALKRISQRFPIRAISISTHGASVVCVGREGKPAVPPLAYTNEVDEEVHTEFFRLFGSPKQLQEETATAEVRPLINVGKLLFFVSKRYREEFTRVKHVLLYPQYFGYRLTGIPAADITYAGCHTYLWNPHTGDWSRVVDGLGLRSLLPARVQKPVELLGPILPEVVKATGLSPDTQVTLGIHDSNSSMVPYLISQTEDFVLNSTGTWCVAMHAMDKVQFSPEELGKMVFYNLSYRGSPIKTSILVGGLELDTYWGLLKQFHNRSDDPGWIPRIYREVLEEKSLFVLPSVLRGAGQFPSSVPRVIEKNHPYTLEELQAGKVFPPAFKNYEKALAAVNISVALQTKVALERVGLKPGVRVYIEGGFRKNEAYLKLLASLLPENRLFLTSFEEATSVGAALCGMAALNKVLPEHFRHLVQIDLQPVPAEALPAITDYGERFLELLR